MKSITRKDGGMYQCFAFGLDLNDIAIGSSQLDLGGKTNIITRKLDLHAFALFLVLREVLQHTLILSSMS